MNDLSCRFETEIWFPDLYHSANGIAITERLRLQSFVNGRSLFYADSGNDISFYVVA